MSIDLFCFNASQCNIKAMSKNEKIKAQIDYLKGLIFLLLTAVFAIIGWIVTIRKTAEALDLILVGVGLVILSLVIYAVNKLIFKKFDELGNLKDRQ